MSNKEQDVSVHCVVPLQSSEIVSVGAYQAAMKQKMNKGQRIRLLVRVLDKLGYNSNGDEEFYDIIREYREDYPRSEERRVGKEWRSRWSPYD